MMTVSGPDSFSLQNFASLGYRYDICVLTFITSEQSQTGTGTSIGPNNKINKCIIT